MTRDDRPSQSPNDSTGTGFHALDFARRPPDEMLRRARSFHEARGDDLD